MSLALYMDEHIHSAITVGLRLRDVDVLTVGDCIRDLEIIAKLGELEEFVNRVQYLPL